MSYQLEFCSDGRVKIFTYMNGEVTNTVADVNRLCALVPADIMAAVRDRCAAFLDATRAAALPPKEVRQ